MTRFRIYVALMAVGVFASCGNTQNDDYVIKNIWSGLTTAGQRASDKLDVAALRSGLTPEVLAQIGGPVLIAQVPSRDAVALLTKIGANDGVDTYLTPDGISISLRDGMVVATRGLGFDLITADIVEPLRALRGSAQSAVRIHRYLDGDNRLTARSFVCTYAATGPRRIEESCTSLTESFENEYIVDKNGKVTSSRQWVSPQIGPILTELID